MPSSSAQFSSRGASPASLRSRPIEDRAGWAELVRRHGGVAARRLGELTVEDLEAAALLGIVVADAPHTPALTRLSSAQAVAALVIGDGEGGPPSSEGANRILVLLEREGKPAFLLNDGPVGGRGEEPGSVRITRSEANELLGAAMSGELEWELDPDFGYEVPLATPSLSGERAMALAPRLAYAANGRVYEHAQLVPALKEERHTLLAAIPGLDPAIVAASGWPVEPTGSSWRGLRDSSRSA